MEGGGSPNQPIRPELEAGTSQNNTPEARPIWTLDYQSRGPLSPDDTASILPCIRSRVLSYHFDKANGDCGPPGPSGGIFI